MLLHMYIYIVHAHVDINQAHKVCYIDHVQGRTDLNSMYTVKPDTCSDHPREAQNVALTRSIRIPSIPGSHRVYPQT